VWLQDNGGERDVFASRYSDGVWKKAEPVTGAIVNAEEPQVAVLPNGEALAIWRQTVPFIGATVFFSRTDQGKWQGAQILQSGQGLGDIDGLELKAGGTGNAMAVWARAGATPNDDSRIFASDFRSGAQPVTQQIDLGAGSADLPDVAIDSAGNVVVAWRQVDELNNNVHRVLVAHNIDGKWEGVVLVSDPNAVSGVDALGPKVAAGTEGIASVLWILENGQAEINSSTLFSDKQWNGVEIVHEDVINEANFHHQITVDGLGNTTVVFFKFVNGDNKFGSFRKLSTGIQVNLVPINGAVGGKLQLGSGHDGGAIAVWPERKASNFLSMVASRLDPATGQWSTPELIETESRGEAEEPSLAMNARGAALAGWLQQDGTLDANNAAVNSIAGNIFK
jgi:hypothetical protein